MEPFSQEKNGLGPDKPFQAQGSAPKAGALRPFTAVDLAPPATPGKNGLQSPSLSPFLETFASPFTAPETKPSINPANPAPAPEIPRPRPVLHIDEPSAEEDFMPVAMPAMPSAGRSSQILPAADIHAKGGSARKPRFFLTSTAAVDGHPIQDYLDVISAEIVLPKDLLFRNPAPYGELHRLKAAEDQLQKVKAKALEELSDKAKQLHADAIVGVQVTFINLDTVCCLCSVVGTAVKLV